MTAAMIMAGGRGERMRASLQRRIGGAAVPKPLVSIRGVPLLERNLVALLQAGVRDITVTVSTSLPDVEEFACTRVRALARALGGEVSCLREDRPLGTIGAVAHLPRLEGSNDPLLVVNADNLTGIDLRAMVEHHRRRSASMTIATHHETFVMPFGEVRSGAGRVTAYLEKPRAETVISSGVYVLGSAAIAAVPRERSMAVPTLIERLLAARADVATYEHAMPWSDVNDVAGIDRAEAMVTTHADLFERWPGQPDVEVVGAVIVSRAGVLLEKRPDSASAYPGQWDTPGGKIEPGESPAQALVRELREELAVEPAFARLLAVFDDLDPASRKLFRHHVFAVELGSARPAPRLRQELRWTPADGTSRLSPLSPVVPRSLAALENVS